MPEGKLQRSKKREYHIAIFSKDLCVLLHAIPLPLLNVLKEKLSVTLDQMLNVGRETTVCLKVLHVLHHVILLLPLNVMMGSLSVTWEPMVDAGWAIIVCLKVRE